MVKVAHVCIGRRDAAGTRIVGEWRIVLRQIFDTQTDLDRVVNLVRGTDIQYAV